MEKPSKINPGETVVIAFVEFQDVHSATEALHALQVQQRRLCETRSIVQVPNGCCSELCTPVDANLCVFLLA